MLLELGRFPLIGFVLILSTHCLSSVHAVEFSVEYLVELTTDLNRLDTNRSNFFGLGLAGVTHESEFKDGTFSLHNSYLWLHGESLSNTLGDVNGFSNIFGPEVLRLNHAWLQYEKSAFTARLGRFDVDEHFMGFDSGANLLNSSFGALATATANMPLPTYPVPGLAGLARYEYAPNSTLTFTVMDGDVGDGSQHDNFGFDLGSSGVGGLLFLSEVRHSSVYFANSLLLLGLAFHSGEFESFSGNKVNNNGFIYVGIEREIYSQNNRSLIASLRLSAAPFNDRNVVTHQADIALAYRGAFNLPNGIISLGLVYAGLGNEFSATQNAESAEWVAELDYRYDLSKNFFVLPSLQYINGGTLNCADIFVGMLRVGMSY